MLKDERPIRVLLLAEAANPEWASVPLIGWNLARALAKVADVHLVTHIRNRPAILRAGLSEGHDFTAIDNEKIASPLFKLSERLRGGAGIGWTTNSAFSSLSYYSFEHNLWNQFRHRVAAHEFDLVHRVTPLSPTSQSIIAKRLAALNVPFILGPLNGGLPWLKNFKDRQYAERDWSSTLRSLIRLMPAYSSTRLYSSAILVGSKFALGEIPSAAKGKTVLIPENGVDPERFRARRRRVPSLPLHAAFVGRLVPYKGVDMLLEACSDFLRKGKLVLNIIGDGPQKEPLELMARNLGIETHLRFYGWLPNVTLQDTLQASDFLVLPSIREFGGGVVLEAMALGLPSIVANYGGPAELVNDKTGVRVKFSDRPSLVEGLKSGVEKFIRSPQLLETLGEEGSKEVALRFTWDAKARQIFSVYQAVLAGRKDISSLNFGFGFLTP
jgi:glycosyltransferase involved in cell wall biosynthesis